MRAREIWIVYLYTLLSQTWPACKGRPGQATASDGVSKRRHHDFSSHVFTFTYFLFVAFGHCRCVSLLLGCRKISPARVVRKKGGQFGSVLVSCSLLSFSIWLSVHSTSRGSSLAVSASFSASECLACFTWRQKRFAVLSRTTM